MCARRKEGEYQAAQRLVLFLMLLSLGTTILLLSKQTNRLDRVDEAVVLLQLVAAVV